MASRNGKNGNGKNGNGKNGNVKNRKNHSDETKELAKARIAAGESLSFVAKSLGVAKSTLHGWLNGNGNGNGHTNGHASAPQDKPMSEQQYVSLADVLGVNHELKAKQRAFLAAYMEIGNVTKAVKVAGVGRTSHYDWLKEDEAYREIFAQAEEAAADRLEEEAWRRAVQGTVKPVFYKGQQVGGIREFSDTLLIFLLNGARPEKYKKFSSHEIKGGLDLRGQVTNTNEHKYHIVQELIGQPEISERIKENFRSRFRAVPGAE